MLHLELLMIKKLSKWLSANQHAYLLSYFIFYLAAFFMLEHFERPYHLIHFFLDDYIPFSEYFVIPYFLWFPSLAISLIGFMIYDKEAFLNLCLMMFGGMTFCLITYALIPNGLDIREEVEGNNLLCQITRWLYSFDTSTNVCPSIHVASSLSIAFAVWKSQKLKAHLKFQYGTIALMILICISTLFIKQHSVIDVFCAILLSFFLYHVAYYTDWKSVVAKTKLYMLWEQRELRLDDDQKWEN